jgi:thiol-disulfide isomerase/thioredoxin
MTHLQGMIKAAAHFLVAFLFCAFTVSAESLSADQILAQAEAKATAEHKVIFVHFGASWCPWCKRLDAFLERPDVKPVFEKYFVPVKLVVQESEQNKAQDTPGGDALLEKVGGPSGLPYSAFLDTRGGLIINSMCPSTVGGSNNIGFPVKPGEVAWFVKMMRTAAPAMSDADVQIIETGLRKPKK